MDIVYILYHTPRRETCVSVCPRETLRLSIGFDLGGPDLLAERKK